MLQRLINRVLLEGTEKKKQKQSETERGGRDCEHKW